MLFIEIGSSEKEWDNKSTASIVCQSVLDTIKNIEKNINNYDIDIGIGIGGNHYPQKFNELILFSSVAFGPIISKYNLAFINEKIIKQMKVKSIEKITHIYIDEKGLGKEKEKVLDICKISGIRDHFCLINKIKITIKLICQILKTIYRKKN